MKRDPRTRPKIGRPASTAAESHAAIMDAVYDLLQEGSAKDLSMEAIAKRAKVGKPTLYKWWPSKAALMMAMFHERIVANPKTPPAAASTAEAALKTTMRRLVKGLNGLFGKVLADLITEGQGDPEVLRDLFEGHIKVRQAADIAAIERGKEKGELASDANADLVINAIFGSLIYRLLLRLPITEKYGDELIDTVLRGIRPRTDSSGGADLHRRC